MTFLQVALDIFDRDGCVILLDSDGEASPPKVMMLIVSCSALRTMIDVRIDSGIEIAMVNVLRQLPRNSRIIRPVKQAAIMASRMTPFTAARTKID